LANFTSTKILISLSITLISHIAIGQCPNAQFTINSANCENEIIDISNNSIGASNYLWTSCPDNLSLGGTSEVVNQGNSIFRASYSLETANYTQGYYGFVIRNNGLFYRFKYLNGLESISEITDLQATDYNLPRDFKMIHINNNYYGMISNSGTSNPVLVNFGSSAINDSPTYSVIRDDLDLTRTNGLDIVSDNNIVYGFIGHDLVGQIDMVKYNDGISLPPTVNSIVVAQASGVQGISLIKECNIWIGLITSTIDSKVIRLNFLNGLDQPPVIEEVTPASADFTSPGKIKIIKENGFYYAFIQESGSKLYRLEFGNSLLNTPEFSLVNTIISNGFGLDVVWQNDSWNVLAVDNINLTKGLFNVAFTQNCDSASQVSYEFEPTNIVFDQEGDYSLKLVTNPDSDSAHAVSQSITISPSLAPQLSSQITGNCLSNPINFSGQQLSGDITSWNWDFGDGTGVSTLQNPAYSYGSAGEYQIKLSVTDANGCNNLYIDTARVYEEPIPAFTIPPGNLCMNNSILFTNSSAGETGDIVTWTWDFNGEGTSTEKDPAFTFITPGPKVVTLTSSIPGCSNTTQQNITIEEAPTVTFSFNRVCNTQATTFTDLTTGNNLTSWSWDFGDGNTSTDQNPTHTYASAGEYSVALTVENDLGCSTSMTETVYSYPPPVVDFNYDLPCSSSPFQFFDQSTAQYTNVVNWEWNFGDGNFSTEQNPLHLYGQTGNYTVQLKAYSEIGCVDSLETMISVIQGPEADFTYDNGCSGEETIFTDQTNNFGLPIISYEWLIEGQTYTGSNVQHQFETLGTYKVNLSVKTSNQCTQSIEKDVVITDVQTTLFDVSEDCNSGGILFTDTTAGEIASRVWLIDGTFLSSDSSFTTDLAPNDYLISLRTTSNSGCENISNQEVSIFGIPQALYSSNISYGAVPLSVNFLNESEGATSYLWQFGDQENQTSTEANPQFTFNEIGEYNVKLIASAEQNCDDTIVQRISVVEPNNNLVIEELVSLQTGQLNLTLNNKGSITYNKSNCQLVFTLDNGAEIREPLDSTLYPLEEIQYIPNFQLGTTGNSQVLCVTLELSQEQEILNLDKACFTLNDQSIITDAYPNPSSDYFNLSVVLSQAEPVTIRLIDSNGGTLLSISDDSAREGLNEYKIDATPYLAGLYIIKIESSSVSKEMKVVINK
jgi:PKD repeat protein